MSGLALATGRLAGGVWRGGSMSRSELTSLASGLGWPVRQGRIEAIDDKAAYLNALGTLAGVPDYVRPNWDSLADGLRDIEIVSRQLLAIETDQPTAFDATAVEILDEAVSFWESQRSTLQVVWFGPIEAPDLDQVDPVKRSRR